MWWLKWKRFTYNHLKCIMTYTDQQLTGVLCFAKMNANISFYIKVHELQQNVMYCTKSNSNFVNALHNHHYKTNLIISYIIAHYETAIYSISSLVSFKIYSEIHHVIFLVLNMLFPDVLVFVVSIFPVILEGSHMLGCLQIKWIENCHLLYCSCDQRNRFSPLTCIKPMQTVKKHMTPQICNETFSSFNNNNRYVHIGRL